MLGLRLYHQTQIDLWQGDVSNFVTDLTIRINAESFEITRRNQPPKKIDFLNCDRTSMRQKFDRMFSDALESGLRHIAIPLHQEDSPLADTARAAFLALRQTLDEKTSKVKNRFTFIASDGDSYDVIQEQFFDAFPDNSLEENH